MISGLRPYPAMKDSGLPWVANLPEHWDIRRMKTVLRERVQKGYPDEPLLAATQSMGVVRKEQYENRTVLALKDLHLLKLVRKGDFVISLRSFQGGIEYAREQGIISPAYTVLYPIRPETHGFVAWLFKSKPYIENLLLHVSGIREGQNIDYDRLSRSHLPTPPFAEQEGIVRFLDHADVRIRHYIRAKMTLIKLLEEQKQAVIYRAVVRGLSPEIGLKQSGVHWLGEIPEHWELHRAKRLFREVDRRSTTGTELLLSLRMYQGLVAHDEVSAIPIPSQNLIGFKRVAPGQIVMNRMRAAIGLFGIAGQPGLVSPDYAVFEPIDGLDPMYYLLLFKTPAAASVFRSESKGLGTGSAGFMRLYTDRFGVIELPVPPEDEQRRIVQAIASSTAKFDRTQDRVRSEVALLRALRTRLIADVATGQIDVRDAAAALPLDAIGHDVVESDKDVAESLAELEGEGPDAEFAGVET